MRQDENGCHLEVYPRPNGETYLCGLGGSDYVNEARLKPGGDCDRPDKIYADPRSAPPSWPTTSDGDRPAAADARAVCMAGEWRRRRRRSAR